MLTSNLEDLMKHVDYFYEHIKSAYNEDITLEVFLKNGKWEIKHSGDGMIFGTTDAKTALKFLIRQNADLHQLHNLMHCIVCTEGVLRRQELKKVEELVGKEEIDRQCEGWDNFAKELVNSIKTHNRTLKVVD